MTIENLYKVICKYPTLKNRCTWHTQNLIKMKFNLINDKEIYNQFEKELKKVEEIYYEKHISYSGTNWLFYIMPVNAVKDFTPGGIVGDSKLEGEAGEEIVFPLSEFQKFLDDIINGKYKKVSD